jgi:REP element-mobilizing transposase RayT
MHPGGVLGAFLLAATKHHCGFMNIVDDWLAERLKTSANARPRIMPSTYLSLHYHLVFSTKDRVPNIDAAWRSRLHDYLGGTIRGLGGIPQGIGGVADHVYLLVGLKATHGLSDVMRELKKASSSWVHDEIGLQMFAWQEGYAAFTVSATARALHSRPGGAPPQKIIP